MWSPLYSACMYRITMNRNRFLFLLRAMRFDDWANRNGNDKFAPLREIWSMFSVRCIINYIPSTNMTVDETMVSFRGNCPFKTYIKMKPDKYAMKVFSLCDSRNSYLCNAWPYLGRHFQTTGAKSAPEQHCESRQQGRGRSRTRSRSARSRSRVSNVPQSQQPQNFQRKSTRYVMMLSRSYYNSRRIITMDSYFTSKELCSELNSLNLRTVGTIRKSQPEVPAELTTTDRSQVQTTRFAFQDDRMLVSFVPKPSKVVLLMSSAHSTTQINGASNKSVVIDDYNVHKGGVDCFNKMVKSMSTNRKSRRWPLRLFFFILDAAALNAFILMKLKSETLDRRGFIKDVAVELALSQIGKRLRNTHVPLSMKFEITEYLKKAGVREDTIEFPIREADATGRPTKSCAQCAANHIKRRATTWCDLCHNAVCGTHHNKIKICTRCVPDKGDEEVESESEDE